MRDENIVSFKPVVVGVKHKRTPARAEKGFAVTLVPESDSGPHMAMGFEGRHYKRSGDSFYPMEHFDLEDMFGRRKKPKLSLFTVLKSRVSSAKSDGAIYETCVMVGIKNVGRGIGRYIYIALKVNPPWIISEYAHQHIFSMGLTSIREPSGDFVRYFGDSNFVIHPHSIIEIADIKQEFPKDVPVIDDLVIEVEIRAEEMMIVHEKRTYRGAEIFAKLHKREGSKR